MAFALERRRWSYGVTEDVAQSDVNQDYVDRMEPCLLDAGATAGYLEMSETRRAIVTAPTVAHGVLAA